ncbi:uncharacterized protein FIBRA_08034 [Fibroporia radiculosa]|uniref:Acyl-CoA oxidase C-alpha1 domain-containing protein n=1 Tax=Fibroporia radiculosa TaxID=599839 RepID=J4GW27_9APHY|nr:uncharacterized protein FIBRA_08034 [Fibroporia radiculosa]CCM05800.1 predicted protein [Fibroporia radiculosa]
MVIDGQYSSCELAQNHLFQQHTEDLPIEDRIRISYERAKCIGKAYALTVTDLIELTPKFWKLHTDPIMAMDGAAGTLVTLQYNLCGGTLAMFSSKRTDLGNVLHDVLSFKVSGQFCLTEVGHGLDVIHLETTATLLPNGEFELHTPHERAAKYMPPTSPLGIPCVAVVFARMMVGGDDHGVKPFVVQLHDGKDMAKGIVCKLLPPRGGSRPLNHSLTYFNHVRLPPSALLGSREKPVDARLAFFYNISRVAVGTIGLASLNIPVMQLASRIGIRYSLRRTIVDNEGKRKPIISFRTQQIPVLTAFAQTVVMQAFQKWAVKIFSNQSTDFRIRHAVASILKIVFVQHAQTSLLALSDRCGAQGLFEVNQLSSMHGDIRGSSIAEGDNLVISIRLATELILQRYTVPSSTHPDGLLARHEAGMLSELRELTKAMQHHRTNEYDRTVLPECLDLVRAIGHRMAYDAAIEAGVDQDLVELYVASCLKEDPAWYVENAKLSRREQKEMEGRAIDAVFPRLHELLALMDVDPYISAPIVSDDAWEKYKDSLRTFCSPSLDDDQQ